MNTSSIKVFEESPSYYNGAYLTPLLMLIGSVGVAFWLSLQDLNLGLLVFVPIILVSAFWLWLTLRPRDRDIERVVIDKNNAVILFENSEIKRSKVYERDSFEIKFDDILSIYNTSYRNSIKSLLLTRDSEIIIPGHLAGYNDLVEELKELSAKTEEPVLLRKPWVQGLIFAICIFGSVILIVVAYAFLIT